MRAVKRQDPNIMVIRQIARDNSNTALIKQFPNGSWELQLKLEGIQVTAHLTTDPNDKNRLFLALVGIPVPMDMHDRIIELLENIIEKTAEKIGAPNPKINPDHISYSAIWNELSLRGGKDLSIIQLKEAQELFRRRHAQSDA